MKWLHVSIVWLTITDAASAAGITMNPPSQEPKCVQIFYDRIPNEEYTFGRTHAIFVQNLLGHFPNVQQIVSPIENYKSGDLEKCVASIYLGTHYKAKIPPIFYWDYVQTKMNVLWAGYHIWNLGAQHLRDLWSVHYQGLSQIDINRRDSNGDPGFFRYYDYKGETFSKYGRPDRAHPERFNAAFEIVKLGLEDSTAANRVVAWARHSVSGERVPYVLRHANHWYIADSPFSFATEDDRYLIFCDLLFDVLNESPRYPEKKPAIFRIEDVHANLPLWHVLNTVDTINEYKIPFQISLIPIYSDPANVNGGAGRRPGIFVTVAQKPEFREFLRLVESERGEFIMHGTTHQSGTYLNPLGTSGDDFEFWDIVRNQPMQEDSPDYVLNRLQMGIEVLEQAGVKPVAWLTPHYQASPLDNVLFGQLFHWVIGRVIYFPDFHSSQRLRMNSRFSYSEAGSARSAERKRFLGDVEVRFPTGTKPNGQIFPYEIFGDVFGQRILPEDLGNLQPFMLEEVQQTKSVDEIVATMKRNRVIRDAWASFFFHPFLLKSTRHGGVSRHPQDVSAIRRLIEAAQDYDYEFVSLREWQKQTPLVLRPQPIEKPY